MAQTPEEINATMDVFGEAFMNMVRERLTLQVLPSQSKNAVRIALVDTHPTTRYAVLVSMVEISVSPVAPVVEARSV